MNRILSRTYRAALSNVSWKSGSPVSVWVMPFVAVVLVIVGIEYLEASTSGETSKQSCLRAFGSNCTYIHRDISLICFAVALCCLIVAAEINRISAQLRGASGIVDRLLKPLDILRYIRYSAKRFFFDIAAFMTLLVFVATGASAIDGSDSIPSWERIELMVFVPTVLVLLTLELISNYDEIIKRLHNFFRELFISLFVSVIVLGHYWADWSWGGIAVASGVVAAINALSQWLISNDSPVTKKSESEK